MGIAEEIHEEHTEHFDEWEKAARNEREQSVDWVKVKERCSREQIKGIKLFVRYRLYEAAASVAKMDMYDFIKLLEDMGICRG